jgi:hypothetical protein
MDSMTGVSSILLKALGYLSLSEVTKTWYSLLATMALAPGASKVTPTNGLNDWDDNLSFITGDLSEQFQQALTYAAQTIDGQFKVSDWVVILCWHNIILVIVVLFCFVL